MTRTVVAIAFALFFISGCGNSEEAQPKAVDDEVAQAKPEPPPPPPPSPEPVAKGAVRSEEAVALESEGEIDAAKVTGVVGRKMNAVEACLEEGLQADPALKGKMTVRFTIGTDGKVSEASAPVNELPPSVAGCVTEAFRGFRFPPAKSGAVTLEVPFLIEPAEGAGWSIKKKDAEIVGTRGTMDPAQVKETVHPEMGKIQACYEQALAKDPKASGRVTVRFVVEAAGLVYSVQTPINELPSEVGTCLVGVFMALRFPAPSDGPATFELPFLFETARE
jgi:hypothetical protein